MCIRGAKMEVSCCSPFAGLKVFTFPEGSTVRDALERLSELQGVPACDFYVLKDGRHPDPEDGLLPGAVYRLAPRLAGGKGGFGSMLRALGAQIEKTTNREACRDLSGRRLRDVNHEKEMAEWMKKQAEREAEREQRRLERLQRKLAEPKHQFSDSDYQQQCHDLAERLEDSVLRGLQAEGGAGAQASPLGAEPAKKKRKMAHLWLGGCELEAMTSSEEDEEGPSTSSAAAAACSTANYKREEVSKRGHGQEKTPKQKEEGDRQEAETLKQEEEGDRQEAETLEQEEGGDRQGEETLKQEEEGDGQEEETPRQEEEGDGQEEETPRQEEDGDRQEEETPKQEEKGDGLEVGEAASSSVACVTSDPGHAGGGVSDGAAATLCQQGLGPCVDVEAASSVEELEQLGLDVLKGALVSRGLKCGGTLRERASRLFSIRGLKAEDIDPSLFAKAKRK